MTTATEFFIIRDNLVRPLWFKYQENGRPALELICADGEPYTTASVNFSHQPLAEDEIVIKTWSENEGVLEALIKAGIVSEPVRFFHSGFVQAPVCKLLVEPHYEKDQV